MKRWLQAISDYPALSCDACGDIEEKEGAPPMCATGVCPKAPPDGPAGVVAALYSELKATGRTLPGQVVIRAFGLTPDRTMVSLLRYMDKTASEVFGRNLTKMEIAQ